MRAGIKGILFLSFCPIVLLIASLFVEAVVLRTVVAAYAWARLLILPLIAVVLAGAAEPEKRRKREEQSEK